MVRPVGPKPTPTTSPSTVAVIGRVVELERDVRRDLEVVGLDRVDLERRLADADARGAARGHGLRVGSAGAEVRIEIDAQRACADDAAGLDDLRSCRGRCPGWGWSARRRARWRPSRRSRAGSVSTKSRPGRETRTERGVVDGLVLRETAGERGGAAASAAARRAASAAARRDEKKEDDAKHVAKARKHETSCVLGQRSARALHLTEKCSCHVAITLHEGHASRAGLPGPIPIVTETPATVTTATRPLDCTHCVTARTTGARAISRKSAKRRVSIADGTRHATRRASPIDPYVSVARCPAG